jgi:hypothetical protein
VTMRQVYRHVIIGMIAVVMLGSAATAHAQTSPWSVHFGLGWDNDLRGNINSSGIGTLFGQTTVILKNTYEEVYGTGLNLQGGVGYMLGDGATELTGTLTFQSLDADYVNRLGDIGVSNLYGQYTDYQVLTLDLGARRYFNTSSNLRPYVGAKIGIGFVDKIDVNLVAPGINLQGQFNDLYDQSTAFSFGADGGVLYQANSTMGIFAQMGLRKVSGLSQVDDLAGTGLESINDKSGRLTLPFIVGVRARF